MSFFDAKFLSLLAFIACNLLALFSLRNRINLIISSIFSCLTMVLFFSASASNYVAFKEVTIALIAYFTIATIITTKCDATLENQTISQRSNKEIYTRRILVGAIAASIFCIIFLLLKTAPQISQSVAETKSKNTITTLANDSDKNITATSHTIHTTKLINHSMLKHYSDGVLIIIAISTCTLISLQQKTSTKNIS